MGPPLRAHPLTRPRPHWPSGRVAVAGLRGGPCCGVLRKFRPFHRAASMQWPLWGQCSAGPGCLSLPHGKNVRAVRPRHGGASLAAPGLDTPTPARCLDKSRHRVGVGRPAAAFSTCKNQGQCRWFLLRREADEKRWAAKQSGPAAPPYYSSRQKVKGCSGQSPPCKRAARALDFLPSL